MVSAIMLDVADAASMDLKDDPFPSASAAAYIVDSNSSSSSENKMIMPHQHQSSEKRETNKNKSKSVCAWRNKFDELRAYTRVNGHCNVPQRFPPNPSLGRWVSRQRFFMRQYLDAEAQGEANVAVPSSGMNVDEKMELLTNIGLQASPKKVTKSSISGVFISRRNTQVWDKRFAELLRYKSIHGNCDVPVKSDGVYKSLGRWVTSQRKKYKEFHSGKLSVDHAEQFLTRFRRLDEIGFKFKIGSGRGSGRPSKK